jgi:hypothetical protein
MYHSITSGLAWNNKNKRDKKAAAQSAAFFIFYLLFQNAVYDIP